MQDPAAHAQRVRRLAGRRRRPRWRRAARTASPALYAIEHRAHEQHAVVGEGFPLLQAAGEARRKTALEREHVPRRGDAEITLRRRAGRHGHRRSGSCISADRREGDGQPAQPGGLKDAADIEVRINRCRIVIDDDRRADCGSAIALRRRRTPRSIVPADRQTTSAADTRSGGAPGRTAVTAACPEARRSAAPRLAPSRPASGPGGAGRPWTRRSIHQPSVPSKSGPASGTMTITGRADQIEIGVEILRRRSRIAPRGIS